MSFLYRWEGRIHIHCPDAREQLAVRGYSIQTFVKTFVVTAPELPISPLLAGQLTPAKQASPP